VRARSSPPWRRPVRRRAPRASDELARVLAAYGRLSPDHRRVLGLRQFEGLDARAAARRMGRSESALHSLYRRALGAWAAECERRAP
jgi:DNA-directed RNA polymerase specialized sigma24 family protein